MNFVIILSAGSGSRMKNKLPKQFIEIDNKPLFIYTLEKFLINEIDKIVLVINEDFKDLYTYYLQKYSIHNIDLVIGGNTRQQSVYNALTYLDKTCTKEDIILIHDGARPLLTNKIILDNINTCKKFKTPVTTVINFVDTIIDKDYNLFDRDNLFGVQTPQTFMFSQIKSIHQNAKENNISSSSDDAQLAKKFGLEIKYVLGSRLNIKITEPEDLVLFSSIRNVGDK